MPIAASDARYRSWMSVGRRLQDHLELLVLVEPVRVLAVAPVGRAAATAARSRRARASGRARGRTSRGASCRRRPRRPTAGGSAGRAPTRSARARRRSPAASPRALPGDRPGSRAGRAGRARGGLRSARGGRPRARGPVPSNPSASVSGGALKKRASSARASLDSTGPDAGLARVAHEAVRGAVVAERRAGERSPAGRAAVERRVEAVQLEQPGLEVAPEQLRVGARPPPRAPPRAPGGRPCPRPRRPEQKASSSSAQPDRKSAASRLRSLARNAECRSSASPSRSSSAPWRP